MYVTFGWRADLPPFCAVQFERVGKDQLYCRGANWPVIKNGEKYSCTCCWGHRTVWWKHKQKSSSLESTWSEGDFFFVGVVILSPSVISVTTIRLPERITEHIGFNAFGGNNLADIELVKLHQIGHQLVHHHAHTQKRQTVITICLARSLWNKGIKKLTI